MFLKRYIIIIYCQNEQQQCQEKLSINLLMGYSFNMRTPPIEEAGILQG